MKKILSIMLIVAAAFAMTSCSQVKAKYQIHSLESLIEKVEKEGDSFTMQDWNEVSAEYDEICAQMNQYEYTNEQLREIGRLKGRYYAVCARKALNPAGGLLNGLIQQASGAVEGIVEGLSEESEGQQSADESDSQLEDEILQGLESLFE